MNRPSDRGQAGVVLITALIMLVMMTLIVLSMLRTNVIELKIGGASQTAAETSANAEAALWAFMNDATNRGRLARGMAPDTELVADLQSLGVDSAHLTHVTINARQIACIEDACRGCGNTLGRTWNFIHFDIEADSRDNVFSGRTVVHQGVNSTVPVGSC